MATTSAPGVRIGELARRAGVSVDVLRAWERRYGLLRPQRSDGGYRLYSAADQQRVLEMVALVDAGLAPAEAARSLEGSDAAATIGSTNSPDSSLGALATSLREALDRFDDTTAQQVLDRVLAQLSVEATLEQVVVPYLHDLGERWAAGAVSVAQEHFASGVLHGRLTSLARGWGSGHGPLAVLACLPGEQHDLGLIAFGLTLAGRGWRIRFLGADTPMSAVRQVVENERPALVVLTTSDRARLSAARAKVRALAERQPVLLAGSGVDARVSRSLGADWLPGGPVQVGRDVSETRMWAVRGSNSRPED